MGSVRVFLMEAVRRAVEGAFKMSVSLKSAAIVSISALALSSAIATTPADAFVGGGRTFHGGAHAFHGGGGWRHGGGWHGGWGGAAVGAGVGLAAGAIAGAALAAPYYGGGCDPYYGCGYGYAPAPAYAPGYYAPGYDPNGGYAGYGSQGGNAGGANFPQP
jgi:hypothetical protein